MHILMCSPSVRLDPVRLPLNIGPYHRINGLPRLIDRVYRLERSCGSMAHGSAV